MASRPSRSLTRAISAVFAERRIYIRTENKTSYLSVKPATQIGGAVCIAALLGWTGFTTSAFVTSALDGHTGRIQLETMSEAYEAQLAAYTAQQRDLEEQLNEANQRRDEVTKRLSEKQARLVEAANSLQEATAELTVLRTEFETLVDLRREDVARIAALDSDLSSARFLLSDARTSKGNLDGALETLSSAMSKVIAERDQAAGNLARLDGEMAELTDTMGRLEDRHERVLSQLETAARTGLAGLGTLFKRSNIDLDEIMKQARRDYTGSGGPFDPFVSAPESEGAEAQDTRVAALTSDLETVSLMRFAADRMPFGEPVFGGRRTSGFGYRRGGTHKGLDIAAPRGTAIHSTADGVVVFSGRQRGYGVVVKIRHAFGFETVYAHLSRSRVKVGQHVDRGDRIADMGNTGRSTGTHLHYEIRIDDKPVNPIKFIEAPRDVL